MVSFVNLLLFFTFNQISCRQHKNWNNDDHSSSLPYNFIRVTDTHPPQIFFRQGSVKNSTWRQIADIYTAEKLGFNSVETCRDIHAAEFPIIEGQDIASLKFDPRGDKPIVQTEKVLKTELDRFKLIYSTDSFITSYHHVGNLFINPSIFPFFSIVGSTRVIVIFRRPQLSHARWLTEDLTADEDSRNTDLPSMDPRGYLERAEDVRMIADTSDPITSSIALIYTHLESIVNGVCVGHMRLAFFFVDSVTGTITMSDPVKIEAPELSIEGQKATIQKNWTPFFSNGTLHFIYRFAPFTVVKLAKTDLNSTSSKISAEKAITVDTVEIVSEIPDRSELPTNANCRQSYGNYWIRNYGHLRGGTPAILIDGLYFLTFFHSKIHVHPGISPKMTYFMGAITFSSQPPFKPLNISRAPIASDFFYQGRWAPGRYYDYIIFPMNYYLSESYSDDINGLKSTHPIFSKERGTGSSSYSSTSKTVITLSLGRNDIDGYIVKMKLQDIVNGMSPYYLDNDCDPLFINSTTQLLPLI